MLTRLAPALALVLTAACTAAPGPPVPWMSPQQATPFAPPRWTRPQPNTRIATATDWNAATGWAYKEAGWDNGLILVTSRDVVDTNDRQFIAYTSKDGRDWHETTPEGVTQLASPSYRSAAGYGTGGYLLGWAKQGLTVWRTENGMRWDAVPLDTGDLDITSPLDFPATITAGPRGVIVVGKVLGDQTPGVFVWHSADGRTFSGRTHVAPSTHMGLSILNAAEATSGGFLLSLSSVSTTSEQKLLTSNDGVHWQDITAGLSRTLQVNQLSSNASTVVAFAFQPGPEFPSEPLTWYRRDGAWHPAKVDPGRLPDAGVVPADKRIITAVRNWGAGFIAIGYTLNVDSRENVGVVWYSADGSAWTRMSVHGNGFDTAAELMDVASTRNTAVLLGASPGTLLMWQAKPPPQTR
jgi:hypothetical protein